MKLPSAVRSHEQVGHEAAARGGASTGAAAASSVHPRGRPRGREMSAAAVVVVAVVLRQHRGQVLVEVERPRRVFGHRRRSAQSIKNLLAQSFIIGLHYALRLSYLVNRFVQYFPLFFSPCKNGLLLKRDAERNEAQL